MNKKLLVAGSLRMITRYKLRTFFMGLGVALGVAALVAARSLGSGSEQAILEKVDRLFGPTSILITASGSRSPAQAGPRTTFTLADLEAIGQQLDHIVASDPMIVLADRQVRYQDRSRQLTLYGHSERAQRVWNRGVIEGRFFTAGDLSAAARVALVGTRLAEDLFGDKSPVGEQILVDSAPFRIIGVLEPIGIDPHGTDRDEDLHVPTTTAMRRLLNIDYITNAKLIVDQAEAVEETAEHVAGILRQRHHIAAGESDDFAIFTPRFVRAMIDRASRVLDVFVPAGAAVTLLVAAIVISSIMLIVVRERIAEVGLRKAVGATERQISYQFLVEAVLVCLASGLAGLVLGAGVVALAAREMQIEMVLTPGSIALGLGAAILVGLLSGLWPARRAARLDPVAALR